MEKEKHSPSDWIGRKVTLWITPRKSVIVIVMEVDSVDGHATKFRAYRRSEKLDKLGFILEGDKWVIGEHQICKN